MEEAKVWYHKKMDEMVNMCVRADKLENYYGVEGFRESWTYQQLLNNIEEELVEKIGRDFADEIIFGFLCNTIKEVD